MNLNVMERLLLRDIMNDRIRTLKSDQNFWTGKTPRAVIDKTLRELRDTQELKKTIFGDEE